MNFRLLFGKNFSTKAKRYQSISLLKILLDINQLIFFLDIIIIYDVLLKPKHSVEYLSSMLFCIYDEIKEFKKLQFLYVRLFLFVKFSKKLLMLETVLLKGFTIQKAISICVAIN